MKKSMLEEKFFLVLMIASTVIVAGSLCLILLTIAIKGFPALSLDMITKLPQGGYCAGPGGGILNAIVGSVVLGIGSTALATCISLPVALYLNLYLRTGNAFGAVIRFVLDILWGIPSIVYGAFGFTLMIIFHIPASLLAGIITITLLIIPIMSRNMDEVLKGLPAELATASYCLGATRLETALKVILRQAVPGLLTAILIAFGRGIGDAASVLFTASFSDYLPGTLLEPVATLPLAIFFQLGTPFPEVRERGYASALILIMIIITISIVSRLILRRFSRHGIGQKP